MATSQATKRAPGVDGNPSQPLSKQEKKMIQALQSTAAEKLQFQPVRRVDIQTPGGVRPLE